MIRFVRLVLIGFALVVVTPSSAFAQGYGPGDQFLVPPSAEAGATVVVEGNACGPNQTVTFFIDGVQVGQTTTNDDPDGYFRAEITIPAGTAPGSVVVTAVCANGEELRATIEVATGAAAPTPVPGGELAVTGTSSSVPLAQVGVGLVTVGMLAVAFGRRTGNSEIPAESRDGASI